MRSKSMDALERIFDKYPNAGKDALIPVLQDIQDELGYLSAAAVRNVSEFLKIPVNRIYSIATFYDQFRFAETGRKHIRICRGTACHVMGSLSLVHEVRKQLAIEPGQSTKDGQFSLEGVQCMGACSLAPVVEVDGKYCENVSPEKLRQIIEQNWSQEDEV